RGARPVGAGDRGGQKLRLSGRGLLVPPACAGVACDGDHPYLRACPGVHRRAVRNRRDRLADHRRWRGDGLRGGRPGGRVRDLGDRGGVSVALAGPAVSAGRFSAILRLRKMSVQAADKRAARSRIGVDREHDSYKWWALSCTSLRMLLATINSATLIIALPDLERSLHTSLLELVWVILVYMIASTVLVLSAGRLSDQFGRKKAYIGGFVLFAAASLGAGFAVGGPQLILWRVLQGIGGAFLFANAAAIVTDAFPREQLGLALGTNTMVAAVGLVIGPILGGVLVSISWHWVFWFNVPLALLGTVWGALVL